MTNEWWTVCIKDKIEQTEIYSARWLVAVMVIGSLAQVLLELPEYGLRPEYSTFLKSNKLNKYVDSYKMATKTRDSLSGYGALDKSPGWGLRIMATLHQSPCWGPNQEWLLPCTRWAGENDVRILLFFFSSSFFGMGCGQWALCT